MSTVRAVGILCLLSALSASYGVILPTAFPVNAVDQVIILNNHSLYTDSSLNLILIGEVQNNGATGVSSVNVEVTFYDKNGTAVGAPRSEMTMLAVIPSGSRSPFKIINQSSTNTIHRLESYRLQIKNYSQVSTNVIREVLQFTLLKGQLSSNALLFMIQGEVKNIGTLDAKNSEIVASCYDTNGRIVLATVDSELSSMTLSSGKIELFWINFTYYGYLPQLAGYTVLVTSNYPTISQMAFLESGLIQIPPSTSTTTTTTPTTTTSTISTTTTTTITTTTTPTSTPSPTPIPYRGCIIATAAYGSEKASEVEYMRYVRDKMIGSNSIGRTLVSGWNSFYYSWSPPLAQFIDTYDVVRPAFQVMLMPLIGTIHVTAYVYSILASVNLSVASVIAFLFASVLSTAIYIMIPILTLWTLYRKIHSIRATKDIVRTLRVRSIL